MMLRWAQTLAELLCLLMVNSRGFLSETLST